MITAYMVCAYSWMGFGVLWLVWALFRRRNKTSDPWHKWLIYRIPEVVGFFLMFHGRHPSFLGRWYESDSAEWVGAGVTEAGLLFAIWARAALGMYWSSVVSLKEGQKVIRSGPYRIVRHPIYTGILTGALGTAICAGTGDAYVGFVILVIGYVIKLRREERLLSGELGDEYRAFQREVPALVPRVL